MIVKGATNEPARRANDPLLENDSNKTVRRLAPLFFISGVAALVYQVCWQRLLFSAFGVDVDSVTIIVAVFMLGLGLGALAGGELADRYPALALRLFALAEFGIGAFGAFSPDMIRVTGDIFVGASQWQVAIVIFLLLLIPTLLMGATLPILVAHVTRLWGNVGKSIGLLYQVNTFGATVGVAVVGFFWFLLFDLDTAVRMAAVLNIAVSFLVLVWVKRHG